MTNRVPIAGWEDKYVMCLNGPDGKPGVWSIRRLQYSKPVVDKSNGYCVICLWNKGKGTKVYMHRLIADAFIPNPDNKPEVDHIDRDRTNNDISNLRWVTGGENKHNIQHKGYYYSSNESRTHKWVAGINVNGKTIYLGRFFLEEEAQQAYKDACLKYYPHMHQDWQKRLKF